MKQDLIEELARVMDLPQKEAQLILEVILGTVATALQAGDRVELRGFGVFGTRQRNPRVGRNPKTGVRIEVPAKRIPFFKPGKDLAALLDGSRSEDCGA